MPKYLHASKPKQYEYYPDKITGCLSKAAMKYKNIIIMDDFHIDIKNKELGYGKLNTICDLFNLTNLIHS